MPKFIKCFPSFCLMLTALLTLSACGQKGALYIADESEQAATTQNQ